MGSLPAPDPTKIGYTFAGWWTGGTGTEMTDNTPVTANITAYAYWSTDPVYIVTYDSQGGTTIGKQHVTLPATTVVALPPEPTQTGYYFVGWYTGTSGTGTEFTAITPVAANITVYAYWSANPVYTVTYNSTGGTDAGTQRVTLPATTVGTLPTTPTKSGYNFGGWYTGPNGTGTAFIASTTVTENIIVYALWNNYSYTVTFDSQGGTAAVPASLTVASPSTTVVALPTAPTKTGYTFAGWFTGTGGSGTEFTASTPVTASIMVHAYWTLNPVYTVTYDSQGGTNVDPQHVTLPATTVGTLPAAPTRTGYIFGGWSTGPGGSGTAFTGSIPVTANIIVYASWISYSYRVNFNSQGGTAISPSYITIASPATTAGTFMPANPTRTNYTFAGWWRGIGGTGTEFTASTPVTGNITVYAYWTQNPVYIVTFDSQGATVAASPASITVVWPDATTATTVGALPTEPTKTGYIFAGWYTDNTNYTTAFTADTLVTASTTVYAKWGPYIPYTVIFDSQDATVAASPASVTLTSPATIVGTSMPTNPTRTGYIFGGWYTGLGGTGTSFTANTPVTANITVYASWTSYSYRVAFNSQGGTAVSPSYITIISPATTAGILMPANPTRTGFTFGGWWTGTGGTGTPFTPSTVVTGNITVYAFWI